MRPSSDPDPFTTISNSASGAAIPAGPDLRRGFAFGLLSVAVMASFLVFSKTGVAAGLTPLISPPSVTA